MEAMENIKLVLIGNIKNRRKHLKMNQEQLAEKSGLSIGYIKNIERGISWPSPESFEAISKGLSTSIGDLLNESSHPKEVVRIKGRTSDLLNELIIRREKVPDDVIDMAQDFSPESEVWDEIRVVFKAALQEKEPDAARKSQGA